MTDALAIDEPPAEKLNTPGLENLLRRKYERDKYALFFDVPDAVSMDARRRIDAVAIGIWKSVGREVHAFELKVSRSDWLRELKQVDKADPFIAICDRFWLVTADASIAKLEEVPACWGWMAATKNGLRVQRPATKLPSDRINMPWGFTVGLLRKLQDELLRSPDVRAHIEQALGTQRDQHARDIERAENRANRELAELREAVKEFEDASGVELRRYAAGNIGEVVKAISDLRWKGGLSAAPKLLREHANELHRMHQLVDQAATAMESASQERA